MALGKYKEYIKKVLGGRFCADEGNYSWGNDYPDKTFMVIRRGASYVGLYSYVSTNLGWIKVADEMGYIPVIDMKNYSNPYLKSGEVRKKNAWEFFYKQPGGYTLDDIKHCKNVVLSGTGVPPTYPSIYMYRDGSLKEWYDLFNKYIEIVPDIKEEIDATEGMIKRDHKRVIGVNIRGTDYTAMKPLGHPVQPTIDEAITRTKEKMAEWEGDAIYLATEDESIVERFLAEFGSCVILPNGKRYDYRKPHKELIIHNSFDRENDEYLRGREYLVKIGVLSRMDYIISSFMGSTYGMSLMNMNYKGEYYWDLGVYTKENG
ncbi:MAG: hypothetical protein K6F86_09015 [Lachnospiraceae bacterium]|nr:hypothetical protein [Lachnospiraceae bacterium]